jgi:uncharacterized protein
MSPNQQTIDRYMAAFRVSDHAAILSCLTDDVTWICPGAFHLTGKAAFDKEINNPAFTGLPDIKVSRMIEQDDVVVAEGTVATTKADGTALHLVFCDVFLMRQAKIQQLTSYLMEVKPNQL